MTASSPHCDELVATMQRIYRYRMTTTSGGNLSIRDRDGSVWITPARVDKGMLTPADIVHVHADDRREGSHPPSSELPFHREIYRRRPDLGAIVHAHPGSLVAFSICRMLPDTRVQSHVYEVCGPVALAPYACPGTEELGESIAATFASGANCVLLENHGVVVGGSDLRDAFQRFETLEFAAHTLIRAAKLGTLNTLSPDELAVNTMPFFRAVPPTPLNEPEAQVRQQLCAFLHRAYHQRLLISTAGAFSARIAHGFVITPRRRDRLELQPDGLVAVRDNACPEGQTPSRAARLHAEIYARHPAVGAVISAQPAHASAFCVTDAAFITHTIPESYIVLRDVPRLPFQRIVEDAAEIGRALDPVKCPVVLIANEGAIVVGRTLLEAFDRLDVLDATAHAVLLAQDLGPVMPMQESALAELRRVYGFE